MNRRKFIKASSAAGVAVTSLSVFPKTSFAETEKNNSEPFLPSTADDFKLSEVTIDELQQKMQSGIYTSRSITEMYLKHIEDIDKKGLHLNSVIELNPDALAIADKMDEERKSKKNERSDAWHSGFDKR